MTTDHLSPDFITARHHARSSTLLSVYALGALVPLAFSAILIFKGPPFSPWDVALILIGICSILLCTSAVFFYLLVSALSTKVYFVLYEDHLLRYNYLWGKMSAPREYPLLPDAYLRIIIEKQSMMMEQNDYIIDLKGNVRQEHARASLQLLSTEGGVQSLLTTTDHEEIHRLAALLCETYPNLQLEHSPSVDDTMPMA